LSSSAHTATEKELKISSSKNQTQQEGERESERRRRRKVTNKPSNNALNIVFPSAPLCAPPQMGHGDKRLFFVPRKCLKRK
jgi:hypothetical protein